MKKQSQHYLVGIDLGTTHTVVAFANIEKNNQEIQLLQIEQLTRKVYKEFNFGVKKV